MSHAPRHHQLKSSSVKINIFENLQDPESCVLARESVTLLAGFHTFYPLSITGVLAFSSLCISVLVSEDRTTRLQA